MSETRFADSSLSPSEKEEREVERLINKKPPPSRKHRPRRGPKHDNRRRRIKVDDPDLDAKDPDLSLNYKSSSLLRVAESVADPVADLVSQVRDKVASASKTLAERFDELSPRLRSQGDQRATDWCNDALKKLRKYSSAPVGGSPARVAAEVSSMWGNDPDDVVARAGTILALERAMDEFGLPASFVSLSKYDPSDAARNRGLVLDLIENFGRSVTRQDLERSDFSRYAAVASAYELLRRKNPLSVRPEDLVDAIKHGVEVVTNRAVEVISVGRMLDEWTKAAREGHFGYAVSDAEAGAHSDANTYFDDLSKDLKDFMSRPSSHVFDPSTTVTAMSDALEKEFGTAPPQLLEIADSLRPSKSSAAASYRPLAFEAMTPKTAAYHGVLLQGHPEGPTNSGWNSPDKRNLGKANFDEIVATAKSILEDDDYMICGWDAGAPDAPVRAALDYAIHVADGGAYQSKIDAETYDMLLNRLAGLGYDQFEETILPVKRSASAMDDPVDSILRVASELRHTHPREALDIIKSLRDAVSGGHTAAEMTDTDKDLPEDKMDDLKDITKKLSDAKSGEDLAKGLKSMADALGKTASGARFASRVASMDLEKLEDMTDEEVAKFVEGLKAVRSGEDLHDALERALSELDKAHVASIRMPIATLVRVAHAHPDLRETLRPFLLAAKKKQDKKKGKTSQKKDEKSDKNGEKGKKAPPFAKKDEKSDKNGEKGKKAPPFAGKKAPPFGKKKASVITASDSEW